MKNKKDAAKRILASLLCAVMLFSAIPVNVFAEELSDSHAERIESTAGDEALTQGFTIEGDSLRAEYEILDFDDGNTEELALISEDEVEEATVDELETVTDEETRLSINEDEAEPAASEENLSDDEASTEAERALPENAVYSDDGLWIYEVIDGYASIVGYTDVTVTNLEIPYVIDGYYVNGIKERAFVENKALSQMYIHGNVVSIAETAFEGLHVELSGYNGTAVLDFAKNNNISYTNVTSVDYFTFTEQVIDYSYVQNGRYYIIDESTIRIGTPEAAQLRVGSIFYIPEIIGELQDVYEVTSIEINGDWADIAFTGAEAEDALIRISMENIELTPDWANAEWSDEVELVEEKLGGSWSMGASQNLNFKHKFRKIPFTFSAEAVLGLKGTVTLDYSVLKGELVEFSAIAEPSLSLKGELKWESGKNTDDKDYLRTIAESVKKEGSSFEVYLGKVPLVSAAGIATVSAALYAKVDINGTVSVSVKGSGKLGVEYNKSKKTIEPINEWSWQKPVIDASGSFAIGPAEALQLEFAVLGKVMSIELFEAVTGEVSWSTEHTECFDIKVGGKLTLSINLKIELFKSPKWSKNTNVNLCELSVHLINLHFEKFRFVDVCTYKDGFTVEFNTDCPTAIDPQPLVGGNKVEEPTISFVGHTLEGWYTDKGFSNKWNFEKDTVTKDMTLYAKWNGTQKTVTYECNYDKEDFTAQQEVGRVIAKPSDPMWIDHRFAGWYKDATLTEAWNFNTDTMPDSDLTLYGKWVEEKGYDPYIANNVSSGEKTFNGHSYTHIMTYMSYSEAKAYAEARGGYLATINSAEEQNFLAQYLYSDCAQTYLWLGMTNSYNWDYWGTGEKVIYTNWNAAPTTSSSQYNAALIRSSGKWTTLSNTDTAHFVIEWGPYVVDSAAAAQTKKDDVQYTYDTATKTATVTGWNNDSANIAISDSYNGYPVTAIAADAFKNNTTLQTITLPNSITTIGNNAFYGCTNLQDISIPNSVTSIGTQVFYGDSNLKSVSWTNKVTTIPVRSFYNCVKLEAITNIGKVTNIDDYAFAYCEKLAAFTYPTALQRIGSYAFRGNRSLTDGVIPDTVSSIGSYAFYDCIGVTGITVPSGVSSLPSYAFYNCKSAATIIIPRSVSSIANNAFSSVNGAYKVYSGSYAETWCRNNNKNVELLGTGTARVTYNTGLSSGGNSLTAKDGALVSDAYIEAGKRITEPELTIEGYQLIGWYTEPEFKNKWDFARDTVAGENITLYAKWVQDESAFSYNIANEKATITGYNSSNETVIIPESLGGYPTAAIADGAFNSEAITSIQIPSCVKTIQSGAFGYADNLYEITVPGSTSFRVEDGVLYTYSMGRLICAPQGRSYISYLIHDGCTTIGKKAFANHSELGFITIPNSVTTIATDAFEGNHDLTIYGAIDTCAAKSFADRHGYYYNIYQIKYYNGTDVLYFANIQAGEQVKDYYVPVADFMTFGGWYKDPSFREPWDFESDVMPAHDINLYLKWNSDFAVLRNGSSVTITGYTGNSSVVTVPETIDGFKVTGIAANAISSGITKIVIPSGVTAFDHHSIPSGVTIVSDEGSSAQSYAETNGNNFEIRKYTVSFDSLGGSEVADIAAVPGTTLTLPVPVRTNYYFAGWYRNTGYSVEWTGDTVMLAEDITLYALWRVANNNITDNFSYNILEDGTVEITAYTGTKTALSIPDTINGYTVSRIGAFAFKNNSTLLTVTIPSTVTSIGAYAFADSSVRTIKGCEHLKKIDDSAFSGAIGLRNIAFTEDLEIIGNSAFLGCRNIFSIALPEGLTSIGTRAFCDCTELYSVSIPSTLRNIGSQAFVNTDLSTITLPSIVKNQVAGVFDADVTIVFAASGTLDILTLKQETASSVRIVWNEVDGASKYCLYRKVENGAFAKVKTVASCETYNYSLQAGAKYTYRVEALDANANVLQTSDDKAISITSFNLPVITAVEQATATTALMTLKKVSLVSGYEVYRASALDGEYTYLKTTTATSFTNTGLIPGGDYYYKVRVFSKDSYGNKTYSDWSEIYYFHMPYKFVSAPVNLNVYQSKLTTAELSWDPVDGAEGYSIYRSVDGAGFVRLKNVNEASAQNYSLKLGSKYAYKVTAYFTEDGKTISSDYSDAVEITALSITTPVITGITQKNASTLVVNWSAVPGANGYEVYRSNSLNGSYSRIKRTTACTTENYNLSKGETYYYRIKAYIEDGSGNYTYGGYSNPYAVTMNALGTVDIKAVEQINADTAKISWNALSGAEGYEVWYKVNDSNEYELLSDTTAKQITSNKLKDGTTYSYKVRGYCLEDNQKYYGDFSAVKSLRVIGTPAISVLEQSAAKTVDIMWSKLKDVAGYELWRSTNGVDFTKVKTIDGNATSNYSLVSGDTYSYKVRAYRTDASGSKTYGFYSDTESIRVLSTPVISSIEQTGANYANIKWNEVNGADGYAVYRSDAKDGIYTLLKNVTDTSTINYNMEVGKRYYYKIAAYANNSGTRRYSVASEVRCITILDKVSIADIEELSSSSVALTWMKVANATGYNVYVSGSDTGEYTLVKTLKSADVENGEYATATVSNLKAEQYHYFKIAPYVDEDRSSHIAPMSSQYKIYVTNLAKPVIASEEQVSETSLKVSWKAINNAEGYEVFRASSITGAYEMVSKVKTNSYTDKSVSVGNRYYYKVRAYKTVSKKSVYGPFSAIYGSIIVNTPVINDVLQNTPTSAYLTWNPVENATGYKVYRADSESGTYTCLKSVTTTEAFNYSLTTNGTYYYKVQAYVDNGTEKTVGVLSAAKKVTLCGLKATKITKAYQSTAGSVKLNWNASTGAEGYELFRAEGNGEYTYIKRVTATSTSNGSLTDGKTYSFMIRPYVTIDGNRVCGAFSEPVSVLLLEAPEMGYVYQTGDTAVTLIWNGVANADNYSVYRKEENGNYLLVGSSTETKLVDGGLTPEITYWYKVTANKAAIGANSCSGYSEEKSITPISFTVGEYPESEHNYSNNMDQTWTYRIPGANALVLTFNSQTKFENNYDKLYITDANGNAVGQSYYTGTQLSGVTIKVDGDTVNLRMTTDGSSVYYGFSFDSISPTFTAEIAAPELTRAYQKSSSTVYLEWEPVIGATKYQVYRKIDNGSFARIANSTGTSYEVSDLVVGSTYTFKIRAIKTLGSKTVYSPYSIEKVIRVYEVSAGGLPESEHPYGNNMNQSWTYSIIGAGALVIRFNENTQFENNYDKLYITDKNGNSVGKSYYTGTELSGKEITVEGDTVNLKMTSDGSVTNYGFSIDYIVPGAY